MDITKNEIILISETVLKVEKLKDYIINRYYFDKRKKAHLLGKLMIKYNTINNVPLFNDNNVTGIYKMLFTHYKIAKAYKNMEMFFKTTPFGYFGINII